MKLLALVSIAFLVICCGSAPQTVTIVREGVECTATLGPDGRPTNINCEQDGGL